MQNIFTICEVAIGENKPIDFGEYFSSREEEHALTREDINEQFNAFIDENTRDVEELETLADRFTKSAKEEDNAAYNIKHSAKAFIMQIGGWMILGMLMTKINRAESHIFITVLICVVIYLLTLVLARMLLKNDIKEYSLHKNSSEACRYALDAINVHLGLHSPGLLGTSNTNLPATRP